MPYAARNGTRLYFEQAGRGDPPMVFVHGWCCDRTFFEPQFDRFKAAHAVTTLDLRGHGKSDVAPDGYDITTLADDVAWLCTELGISKPVVVGHSLGGMIAIELAARYPSLPSAIVGVDPGPIDALPQARDLYTAFAAQMQGPNSDAVRRAYVESLFLTTDDTERKRRIVDTMCSTPLEVAVKVMRGVMAWNGVGALLLCRVPLLVLRAYPGGSNAPARLLALRPDVHIGLTVGAGHFHQLEVPEQVTSMIERFMRVAVPGFAG